MVMQVAPVMEVKAGTLVEDTVNDNNEYSKYPDENYQLDFYVDTSWDWLPWNWKDGIGKQIDIAVYTLADGVWWVSRVFSNATGYIVQEAYSLDFISETADAVGKNIQTLAGVTSSGFSSEGFYVGFLLLFVLILGVYVAYTGLLKRETTKAFNAIINFVVIFLLSASFIAFAPTYINKINEFSSDVSTSALSLGTKILLPNSDTKGSDSVALIRDSLFAIQVKQPWLLLQFGSSDIESIGDERVEKILSVSPDDNKGKDRSEAVENEINDNENMYLTPNKTSTRLGMVLLFLISNLVISVFVILLAGMMLFSQMLFIIYAMILPFSLLLAMLPTYNGLAKRAVERVFNVIMLRTGYTLIITIAFSISSMLYALSSGKPFIFVIFLQILTFAGIFIKQNELLSMLSLNSSENQGFSRRFIRGAGREVRGIKRHVRDMMHMPGNVTRLAKNGIDHVSSGVNGVKKGVNSVKNGVNSVRDRNRSNMSGDSGSNISSSRTSSEKKAAQQTSGKNRNGSVQKGKSSDVVLPNVSGSYETGKEHLSPESVNTNKPIRPPRLNQSDSSTDKKKSDEKSSANSYDKKPDSKNRKPVSGRKNSSIHERPGVSSRQENKERVLVEKSNSSRGNVKEEYHVPKERGNVTKINGIPYTDEQIKNGDHEKRSNKSRKEKSDLERKRTVNDRKKGRGA